MKLSEIWVDKIDGEDDCLAEDPERGGINQIARQVIMNEVTISTTPPAGGLWLEEVTG